jgi:hypothetical protein
MNMSGSLVLHLRQHCQFLSFVFVKTFFEKEVIQSKKIAVNAET